MMRKDVPILEVIDHPDIWAPWFRDPVTWTPWRAFLKVLFGLPLSDADLALFRACTGRGEPPAGGFHEAWLVCGRRAGKSFVLALIACFLAVFRDWSPYLSPGERGTIKIMAVDRRQSRVIHRYARALLVEVPALSELVTEESGDEIVLSNGIVIEIQTASFRSVRGFTIIAALADEIAFWRSDETSANPDAEILAALRPGMGTIPGSMFLAASSPYAKRGELYNAFRRWHGHDDAPALVWHAPTRTMNPTFSQKIVDAAVERDPDFAASEYFAEFRSNIEGYLSREAVEALVVPGRFELPPLPHLQYSAFCDPSGGASDAMTLAIGHPGDDGRIIIDLLREVRPPFSPAVMSGQFATEMHRYRVTMCGADYYAAEWVRERFQEVGIGLIRSERNKSTIYLEFLPIAMTGGIELLDHPRCCHQLYTLERHHNRGGRDSVDHPPGGSDDLANAVAGVAVTMSVGRRPMLAEPESMWVVH